MKRPEIKVSNDVKLEIYDQEFEIRSGESFVVYEDRIVIKPKKQDQSNEEECTVAFRELRN